MIATIAYTAAVTAGILPATNVLVGNRISGEHEVEGLDLVSHNERGYDL